MLVFPKNKPVIENLNSYYLNIDRLIEHAQGELESGCIYFSANTAVGAIFVADHMPVTGVFEDRGNGIRVGQEAIDEIIRTAAGMNFTVAVYGIDPAAVHFWASLNNAEALYTNLSTEFSDLTGLIKKMQSEKLTGYIDIHVGDGNTGGSLFFNVGKVIGGAYSWSDHALDTRKASYQRLIQACNQFGATLNVYALKLASAPPAAEAPVEPASGEIAESEPMGEKQAVADLAMVESYIHILRQTLQASKRPKADFAILLRRKFVEKAELYDFLDPFTGEFEYVDGTVQYHGTVGIDVVFRAIFECLEELAAEFKVTEPFHNNRTPWANRYESVIAEWRIEI